MEIADVLFVIAQGASDSASSDSSDGSSKWISAFFGLAGALIGGGVTWGAERSRQSHDETTRRKKDAELAQGLARVLADDLSNVIRRVKAEREERALLPGFKGTNLGVDERLVLFRHLADGEFASVSKALTAIEIRESMEARRSSPELMAARVRAGGAALTEQERDTLSECIRTWEEALRELQDLVTGRTSPT